MLHGAAGPTGGGSDWDRIRDPVVHADETGWRQEGNNGSRLDFQHSHPAVLPVSRVGARRWWMKSWASLLARAGQRLLRRLPPLRRVPNNALGPSAARHPRPARPLPRNAPLARWAGARPRDLRVPGQRPALGSPGQAPRRTAQVALERQLHRHLPALPRRPVGRTPGQIVPTHRTATSRTLRLRG